MAQEDLERHVRGIVAALDAHRRRVLLANGGRCRGVVGPKSSYRGRENRSSSSQERTEKSQPSGYFSHCENLAMRLLIVEDDGKTARALQSGLQSEGFSVVLAHTGEEGFFLLSSESFDLIVLDWMLPGRDGIEILKAARARGTRIRCRGASC